MAKTKKEKKEKKAGKRMKKKELVKALLDFFHVKQDEVLSLKYIFEQLHLTTHPLKMLCMDILSELSDDDYITEVDKHKYKLNNHGVEMTGTFQRKSNGKNSFIPEGGGDPIFIAERNSAHAMAGDKYVSPFMPNAADAKPKEKSSRYWNVPTIPSWERWRLPNHTLSLLRKTARWPMTSLSPKRN